VLYALALSTALRSSIFTAGRDRTAIRFTIPPQNGGSDARQSFQATFMDAPVFLADIQTADGGDTANHECFYKG
jgi:hypothetical protein